MESNNKRDSEGAAEQDDATDEPAAPSPPAWLRVVAVEFNLVTSEGVERVTPAEGSPVGVDILDWNPPPATTKKDGA